IRQRARDLHGLRIGSHVAPCGRMGRITRLLLVALLAFGISRAARAQGYASSESQPPEADDRWYGWQILAADAGVFALAGVTNRPEVALGWGATGALVHGAHGNPGRALGSVLLRVALPIAGFAIGAAIGEERCRSNPEPGWFCGLGEAA